MGLINKTYVLETALKKYIFQEVSPIFDVSIHDDCHAVQNHLARYGINAPSLVPTSLGQLYYRHEHRVFRVINYIEGRSFHKVLSLKMALEAGKVVGRFHRAVSDLEYEYRSKRAHGGDYAFHLNRLTTALKAHQGHDFYARVEPLAARMIENMRELTHNLSTTIRHAHGDPKISNIMFDENDEGICLVDFDTLSKTGWSLEMGDAFRSWCNPHEEDELDVEVDLKIAEQALLGYGSHMRGILSPKELLELSIHAPAITLCLGIRYLTDVLNENYWAYDQARFERPAPHNLLRAQAMFRLFEDFRRHKSVISELINSLLR